MQTKHTKISPFKLDFELRTEDANAIRKLVSHSAVFNEVEIEIAGELADDALSGRDSSYKFVFLRDSAGVPIAYTCYGEIPLTDKRYDLYWIVVSPDYQGRGLARQLLLETELKISEYGGCHIYAETSGTADYAPARSFYLKNGFSEIARFPNFYRDGDDKEVFVKII